MPKGTYQFSSVAQSCPTLYDPMCQASLSIANSQSLLKLKSIESVMPPNHLILCHPLLLPPSIFPSIRVFSNESVLQIRWPKYWSISFSISPSNECSGLISFKMDWLDLLAVQGTLKSLLQHHSSKASKGHISNLPKTARIEKGAWRSARVAKWLGFWAFTSVARGQSLVPGCGTEIPQVVQCGRKKRKKKKEFGFGHPLLSSH